MGVFLVFRTGPAVEDIRGGFRWRTDSEPDRDESMFLVQRSCGSVFLGGIELELVRFLHGSGWTEAEELAAPIRAAVGAADENAIFGEVNAFPTSEACGACLETTESEVIAG